MQGCRSMVLQRGGSASFVQKREEHGEESSLTFDMVFLRKQCNGSPKKDPLSFLDRLSSTTLLVS